MPNRAVSSCPNVPRYVLSRLVSDGGWTVSPYTRAYSALLCRLRKGVDLVGESRLYVHPSTMLRMQNSEIVVENGILRLGLCHFHMPYEYDANRDNCRIYLDNAVIRVNGDVVFCPGSRIVAVGGTLVVGGGTAVHAPNYIFVRKRVEIGQRCLIARFFTVMDSDWHKLAIGSHEPKEEMKDVVIEDHCWIGQNVTILKGVTVGEGAVIGANSVVTRNVEPRTMVVGNPAHVLHDKVTWET